MIAIAPWIWLVFGLVLISFEMFALTFAMLMFGIAAILTALISWILPIGGVTQILFWLVTSGVLCVLWFGLVNPKLKNKTKAGLGGEAWIGEIGFITRLPGDGIMGKVRFTTPVLGADEWSCRTTAPVELGQRVMLKQIIGNEMLVAPVG